MRVAAMAGRARNTPRVGRALYLARGQADRALIAARRPPLSASVEDGVLAGYLRHRGFLEEVSRTGYESFLRELFLDRIRPGTTVVDAGAHIGLFTVAAAPRAGPTGQVYAFEADPYNYEALRVNIERNALTNVRAVNQAVADVTGEVTFILSSSTVGSSLVAQDSITDAEPVKVAATTLDAEIPPDRARELVVKIDVEGAEEQVLRGAAETLQRCARARLILEQHQTGLDEVDSSSRAVVPLLRSLGFTPFFVDEERRELVQIQEAPPPRRGNHLLADKG